MVTVPCLYSYVTFINSRKMHIKKDAGHKSSTETDHDSVVNRDKKVWGKEQKCKRRMCSDIPGIGNNTKTEWPACDIIGVRNCCTHFCSYASTSTMTITTVHSVHILYFVFIRFSDSVCVHYNAWREGFQCYFYEGRTSDIQFTNESNRLSNLFL